jgi:hypothetical protein
MRMSVRRVRRHPSTERPFGAYCASICAITNEDPTYAFNAAASAVPSPFSRSNIVAALRASGALGLPKVYSKRDFSP